MKECHHILKYVVQNYCGGWEVYCVSCNEFLAYYPALGTGGYIG